MGEDRVGGEVTRWKGEEHEISGMVVTIHILPLTPCRKSDNDEVEDNRDTVSEISLTQCTQRLQDGTSTIMCRCWGLGGVAAGQ